MRAPWLRIAATLAALAAAGFSAPARADSYPAKPIAIIVPAAPGGVTDMLGRILAQRFIADWGAQAVVENDAQYFESITGSSEDLSARIGAEEPKWRKLIRESHITAE